jgi:hypothetical protein
MRGRFSLQETKFQQVDMQLVRKFAPRRFDKFDFVPSAGASGGILVLWNSSLFQGTTLDKQSFGISISFNSLLNSAQWKMTTVYGPCQNPERAAFVSWLRSHTIPDDEN